VLEAVFGDAAVRDLADQARADLQDRAAELLAFEQARFDSRLDDAVPGPSAAEGLRAAARDLAAVRRAAA
jgi:hypothetical protein